VYLYIFTFRYTEVAGWLCIYIYECKQRVYVCMCIFTYMSSRSDVGVYVEEDTLGVFRLGRVKSLETLGTIVGLLNFIEFLETWNVSWNLDEKIYPNSQFLLNTISLTGRSNRQPGSTA